MEINLLFNMIDQKNIDLIQKDDYEQFFKYFVNYFI